MHQAAGLVAGGAGTPAAPPLAASLPGRRRAADSVRAARAQDTASLGRSHRSKLGKARLKKAIDDSKRILGLPDDYLLGIVRRSLLVPAPPSPRLTRRAAAAAAAALTGAGLGHGRLRDGDVEHARRAQRRRVPLVRPAPLSSLGTRADRPVAGVGRESFGKGWFGDATAHLKLNESVECALLHGQSGLAR